MAKAVISQTKKNTKKSFYEVSAPLTATKISLYAASPEELEGKTVKIDLTKSLKGKSLELKMRVKKDKDSLFCDPESIELAGSYVRRMMRRGTDYCEDSFETECRDCFARIKPLMITRRRVSRAVLKSLRNEAKETISTYAKARTARELFSEIMANKLQKQLALRLKKIYPLALCEIRVFEITKLKENSSVEAAA
jgi:ribosomal protein S3AE